MAAAYPDPESTFHITKQKPPPEAVPAEMRFLLSSHPPVGQVTQVASREVLFRAILEVDQTRASKPWQVALWHCHDGGGGDWAESALVPTPSGSEPCVLQSLDASLARLHFSASFPVDPPLRFTLKFREAPDQEWRWVRDVHGIDDGVVIGTTGPAQGDVNEGPEDIIHGLDPSVKVKSAPSQCPGTQLWTFEATVRGADGDTSSSSDIELGLPWGGFLR